VKLRIAHTTTYSYDATVSYALQQVRLHPVDGPQQKILQWSIDIASGRREFSFNDQHGNHTVLVNLEQSETVVAITAGGEVETTDSSGILGKIYGRVPLWHYRK
jgi:transglutaminase-like putative cysteine protease